MSTYNYLDYVPKGRGEEHLPHVFGLRTRHGDDDGLPFTMEWIRHHDRYSDGKLADNDKPYWPATAASAS